MSKIENEEIRVLIQELDNEYGQDKLQYLKKEGHGSFYISTKAITEKFYEVIEQKALEIYKENNKNIHLMEKYTQILKQESFLALSVVQREEIGNLIEKLALTYESRDLTFSEIQFLRTYYKADDLNLSIELSSLNQQKTPTKIKNGKSNTISTALTGMALLGHKLQSDQMAEDLSSIAESVSSPPDLNSEE